MADEIENDPISRRSVAHAIMVGTLSVCFLERSVLVDDVISRTPCREKLPAFSSTSQHTLDAVITSVDDGCIVPERSGISWQVTS